MGKESLEKCGEKRKTIQETVRDGLCTACGTCVGVCPQSAIVLVIDNKKGNYVPKINLAKCNQCGLCLKSCPGDSVDFRQLNTELFGKEPNDLLVGNYINFYISNSTNHEIRYNSSSGGLITELLIYALENGIIDGALVTKMSEEDPLHPEPFIARTRDEIICASKSKYCPVPVNVVLKELLNTSGRFAVVGLPCHIQGIRKAALVNAKLSERVIFTFGLMCSYNRNFLASEYVLHRLGIKKEDVTKLDYRGEGYLGSLSVTLKGGQKKSVPYVEYYNHWLRSFFYLPRCTLCIDHTCELADISFGDNWMPEFQKESIGSSILISRTKRAEELLASALETERIELSKVERSRVVRSKKGSLIRKKNYLGTRMALFKLLGKRTPIYNQPLSKGGPFAYLDAIITYLQIYISQKRRLWRFLGTFSNFLKLASALKKEGS